LNTGRFYFEPITLYKDWLGGSGIGQWILYKEIKPWVTPFDPANRLVIGTGPLTGTLAPSSSRITAESKSPLTKGIGTSNAGGFAAAELKYAGYDHIVFKGKAHKPVYLWISDDTVQLKDASHLWGKTTWDTEDIIKAELGDPRIQVLSIGPAGENLVPGASIIVNKERALGRCGLGAVMGSKNLKAIAIRGHGSVKVADPDAFMEIVERTIDNYKVSNTVINAAKYGTLGATDRRVKHSGMAYKNHQELEIPPEMIKDTFNPEKIDKEYRVRQLSCFACPITCRRHYHINNGPYAGLKTEAPQFESLVSYAAKLAVNNFAFVIKVTAICNQYGIDVDLPAGAIAWAMECYDRGLLSAGDFDGLIPVWGDEKVILKLVNKIIYRDGIGDILSEGAARAADIMGSETKYYAMHVKGQDLYEPMRFAVGWSLGTCVSTRGGGHTTGAPTCELLSFADQKRARDIFGVDTFNHPTAYEGKARLVRFHEMLHRLNNSLGLCHFSTVARDVTFPGFEEITRLYNAVTGERFSIDDMQYKALRILNMEKAFNILHGGFGRQDDYPPLRAMEEPNPAGVNMGFYLEKDKFDALLNEYYDLHGWDKETSYPTRRILTNLNLEFVADDLKISD
ncbi:MAG: aldehyde ferredoxin oxidoreductase family protein, partial [Syntrophomonadaceae bacterium]|nr:aldehyde ferredoxin oxidoreductase family protein [Syntrophomonadaceae bacterium]